MKIPQETIDSILEIYNPDCRYLKNAELDFPIARGRFSIPSSFYIEDTGHFNAVELLICYNQLAYSFFAEAGRLGLMKEVGVVPLDKFRENQLGKYLIAKTNKMKFRREINPREFEGAMELRDVKRMKNNLFFRTNFDFNNGSASGEITLVSLGS